jgi:two-component sensor histidine kinase
MTPLFWVDLAVTSLFTVISSALCLIALSAGPRNPVNRNFALFAAIQTAKGVCSVYLRITLWIVRGNPQHWANWEALFFLLSAVALLLFTVRYLEFSDRKHVFVVLLTGVVLLFLIRPILTGAVLIRPRLDPNGTTLVTVTPLGFAVSVMPFLYYAWALVLFARVRRDTREPYMAASILIMQAGFVAGAVINVPIPVLAFTECFSMAVLGYGVLSRQLFNPLRLTTENLRREVAEREAARQALRQSLDEKEVLLREVHHRVKNNLQVVSSLLHLQSQQVKDRKIHGLFEESRHRIHSMALIHEQLYGTSSFTDVHFRDYAADLIRNLLHSYGRPDRPIDARLDVSVRHLNIGQAIPCGLVLNEIISNSLKYAFPPSFRGRAKLAVRMKERAGGRVLLTVSDNGVGMRKPAAFGAGGSMGLRLIRILAEDQLKGDVRLTTAAGKGTVYRIAFKEDAGEGAGTAEPAVFMAK